MESKSVITVAAANRCREGRFGGLAAVAAAATLLLVPAPAHAAEPAASAVAGKTPAVRLESVPGSNVPRVILSAKAAERLGIETGKVREEAVVRRQMVSGLIIPPMDKPPQARPAAGGFGGVGRAAGAPSPQRAADDAPAQKMANVGFGLFSRMPAAPTPEAVDQPGAQPVALPATKEVWVLVALSPAEWERLAQDKPAQLLPLATREERTKQIIARPSGMQPDEDRKRLMMKLYYVVPGKDHGLAVNSRVRVELQLASDDDRKQKVVPYGAVFYDAKGDAWVFVAEQPLTYERQRIVVERVVGDLAVLSAGPATGTPVVTVGAALLYGAEVYRK